jgi:CheY-like chemotaxis protein
VLSWERGYTKIKIEKYDRVVCDLMLQDITGFDIIEESKNVYIETPLSKIFVIMTAYSSEQVLEKAKSYGCLVLQKPFTNLEQALQEMTEK